MTVAALAGLIAAIGRILYNREEQRRLAQQLDPPSMRYWLNANLDDWDFARSDPDGWWTATRCDNSWEADNDD
jgi:hypothetical protein